jgi:predicted CoA-binding protein
VTLGDARSILLVDWPSRDVPEALARRGLAVYARERGDVHTAYVVRGEEVVAEESDEPQHVDLVYAYRPLVELPGISADAKRLGATVVWFEPGPTPPTDAELAAAREIVESEGLVFMSGRISEA